MRLSTILLAAITLFSTSINGMEVKSMKTEVLILALEGEGVRAILPLTVLDKIEEHLKGDIRFSDCFDIITATGTGAQIIADGLNSQKRAKNLLGRYRDGKDLVAATKILSQDTHSKDPIYISVMQALKNYPSSNFFIVTLGAGSVPSYEFSTPENVKKASLYQLLEEVRKSGKTVEHIAIDISISQDLAKPNLIENAQHLRQAGLALCNSQNPSGSSQNIQKIIMKLNENNNIK